MAFIIDSISHSNKRVIFEFSNISSIDDIEVNLRDLPDLTDRLADVREETLRYSQLATAQENLKHLFTVPETVDKTETQIVDGKLLDAHKALSELEQSRDDLVRFILLLEDNIS